MTVPTQVSKNVQSTNNNIINATFPIQIQENFKHWLTQKL